MEVGGCGNRACTCKDRAQPPAQSWNIGSRCSVGPYIDPILNQGSPTELHIAAPRGRTRTTSNAWWKSASRASNWRQAHVTRKITSVSIGSHQVRNLWPGGPTCMGKIPPLIMRSPLEGGYKRGKRGKDWGLENWRIERGKKRNIVR